jgi:hypothetical protein
MRLDDLREAKNRRPFTPFDIRTADGREITISHPDALSWEGPDFAPVLFVVMPGGRWNVINFAAITSLVIASPSEAAQPRAEGDRA